MKFSKLNNPKVRVNVNVSKYLVDWDRRVSGPQFTVKQFLKPYWATSVVCEEMVIPGSRNRVDLINLSRKIAVEVSPDSSHSFNQFFHKDRNTFGRAVGRELSKAKWLEREGFQLVEVFEDDLPLLSVGWFASRYGITL